VDEGIPVALGGTELVHLFEASSPYLTRMFSILKHSVADLLITSTKDGGKLVNILQEVSFFILTSSLHFYSMLAETY
jgi:hypothetical protein